MTELDASARAMLKAARHGYDPTPDDHERVKAALVPALAGARGPTPADIAQSSPAAATTAGSVTLAKLVAGGVMIGAVGFGGGYAVGQKAVPEPPVPATHPAASPPRSDLTNPAAPARAAAPPAASPDDEADLDDDGAPRRASARQPRSRPATPKKAPEGESTLGEEVTLLRRAQRSLREGDPAGSLALLDWMKERYPSGTLAEERTVARVLALCGAGKATQAQALAKRFLAKHPGSVHAARLRASCAFSRPDEPEE